MYYVYLSLSLYPSIYLSFFIYLSIYLSIYVEMQIPVFNFLIIFLQHNFDSVYDH